MVDLYPEHRARPLRAFRAPCRDGQVAAWHRHPTGEMLWSPTGALRVSTLRGVWIVPPGLAAWLPAREPHEVKYVGSVELVALFPNVVRGPRFPAEPCLTWVAAPLRRLLETASNEMPEPDATRAVQRLGPLVRDAGVPPLDDPFRPRARSRPVRLEPLLGTLYEDPTHPLPLSLWSEVLRMHPRTLSRAVERETGMSFRRWRTQVRLCFALERLALGESVARVARRLGYRRPAMFRAWFSRGLGATPGSYFRMPQAEAMPTDPGVRS